ncbi:MAG: hypothetical protein RIM23_16520 [Coleofasciculus sp. G3-WIS-01]
MLANVSKNISVDGEYFICTAQVQGDSPLWSTEMTDNLGSSDRALT